MELFDIPTNALLAQVIGGFLTGMICGVFIQSDYEKKQSVEDKKKVWRWKNYEQSFGQSSYFMIIVKIIAGLFMIGLMNIQIAKYFDAYPMSKTGANSLTLSVVALATMFMAKGIRYLYFRKKLEKYI